MSQSAMISAFRNFQTSNIQLAPEWPAPGEHDALIVDLTWEQGELKYGDTGKVPCLKVRYTYQLLHADPTKPEKPPLKFTGATVDYPLAELPADMSEGRRKAVEISLGRFLSGLQVINGTDPRGVVDSAVEAAYNRIKNPGTPVMIRLLAEYRTKGDTTYKSDRIVRLLSK
jgi:hypothetical protein